MVLTIVDTFTRFSPGVDRRFSYKGENVVATLERICRSIGYPASIRVDRGSEFISRDLDLWAYALKRRSALGANGSDIVGKALALGGATHWTVDRGPISPSDDLHPHLHLHWQANYRIRLKRWAVNRRGRWRGHRNFYVGVKRTRLRNPFQMRS